MNISADDKPVSQTPDHHGLQFHCVRDLCKTEQKKKAFNPCFNPSEFIIQSVVSPLIF